MEKRISAKRQYEMKLLLADTLYEKMMSYTTPDSFDKASNLIILDNHKILFRKKSGNRYILKSLFKYSIDLDFNAFFTLNIGYSIDNFYSFWINGDFIDFKNEKYVFLNHDWFKYGAQKLKNTINPSLSNILLNSNSLNFKVIMNESESYINIPFVICSKLMKCLLTYDLNFDLDFNLISITLKVLSNERISYNIDLNKFSTSNFIKAFEVMFAYYMDDTLYKSIDNSGIDYIALPATFFNDENISTYHDLVCMINV